jgi:hypothetical protein
MYPLKVSGHNKAVPLSSLEIFVTLNPVPPVTGLKENTIHHLELLYLHECDLGVNHHLWCFVVQYRCSFTLLKKQFLKLLEQQRFPKDTLETP